MNSFFLILGYNLKRVFTDIWAISLLLVIPLGLTVINGLFDDPASLNGYNVSASMNMPAFLLGFQFFKMGILLHYLYNDLRGDMRWRLRATPHSLLSFILPTFVAGWIISLVLGLIIVLISVVFLDVYLGNLFIFAAVLLLVSLMANCLAMLLFLFTKKFSLANTLVYVISFGLMILSGFMIPLGDSAIADFLREHGTPLVLGARAIVYSGGLNDLPLFMDGSEIVTGPGISQSLTNVGILAAITAVIVAATIIAAKVREI